MAVLTERIRRKPGLMGGDACVRDTRIPVWLLAGWRDLGWDDARLLDEYPGLTQADLDAAWAFQRDNAAQVECERLRHEGDDEE